MDSVTWVQFLYKAVYVSPPVIALWERHESIYYTPFTYTQNFGQINGQDEPFNLGEQNLKFDNIKSTNICEPNHPK